MIPLKTRLRFAVPILCIVTAVFHNFGSSAWADESNQASRIEKYESPHTIREARDRAILLHETIRGTLQVVHRDLFDDEDAFAIPSNSLEDVFEELANRYQVDIRWLVVNTDVLNVEHKPKNDFEKSAVASLAAGNPSFERTSKDRYSFAGAIRLKSQCLKCHVKRRTDTGERIAGLSITMPIHRHSKATP